MGKGRKRAVQIALLASLLVVWGSEGGCAKRPWEIQHPPRPRNAPPPSPRARPRKGPHRKPGQEAEKPGRGGAAGKKGEKGWAGPGLPLGRAQAGRKGPGLEAARASCFPLPPPYPWPALPPPGWKERRPAWDPVAWFEALREELESFPPEWILQKEAALAKEERAWTGGEKGPSFLSWKSLPSLPPLRGGKDFPGKKPWKGGRKALLGGFLLRVGEKGPCFLVPRLFGLRRANKVPGPGERVLLRFRKGASIPPAFAALLVLGRLEAKPCWSRDTLVAAFSMVPERIRLLP